MSASNLAEQLDPREKGRAEAEHASRGPSKTEQMCAYIARHGAVRSSTLTTEFSISNGNLLNMLEAPLGNGFLTSCKVIAPSTNGAQREMLEFRVSASAKGVDYAVWKQRAHDARRASLKAPVLSDRAAAAIAAAEPPVERPKVAGNPISARRQAVTQPAVVQNTGSARSVASSSTASAEARTVAPTPAAQPAPSPARSGRDVSNPSQPAVERNTGSAGSVAPTSTPFAEACAVAPTPAAPPALSTPARSGRDVSSPEPSWMISSDGTLAITHGDAGMLLSAEQARRLARVLAFATPLLDEIHEQQAQA